MQVTAGCRSPIAHCVSLTAGRFTTKHDAFRSSDARGSAKTPIARPGIGYMSGCAGRGERTRRPATRVNVERTPMSKQPRRAGRHFLQIPGPTPVPERILNAMSRQILDHRGPSSRSSASACWPTSRVFQDDRPGHHLSRRPAPARGKPALVNTLSPGDHVLMSRPASSPCCGATWPAARPQARGHPDRLAHRRRRERRSSRSCAQDKSARDQGRVRRAQRDLDRLRARGSTRSARRWTPPSIRRC